MLVVMTEERLRYHYRVYGSLRCSSRIMKMVMVAHEDKMHCQTASESRRPVVVCRFQPSVPDPVSPA